MSRRVEFAVVPVGHPAMIGPGPKDPPHHTTEEHWDGYLFTRGFRASRQCDRCYEIAVEVLGIEVPQ